MPQLHVHELIGIIGVVVMLYAYFGLQAGIMNSRKLLFSVLNFTGAVMILYSLYWQWNLPSVIIEACWALISLYGILKCLKRI